ncbi:hypothetical protein CLV30_12834 [Haloactinopolyspora alba]|uniref:Uncharacterized protein n=1 Tax=Haloactinopolyspora alba TaxID=648780 RepID=A0A2P8DEZ9_9ACTN|nr:hypothetical protein [Haloactinopolyspora alba]PSK95782.1 hypothetical protein CLV30_12834 [Haloactinopolyspora alba]
MTTAGPDEDGTQPLGPVVDALGMRCTLAADDLVGGAVVVMKVTDVDGQTRLSTWWSDGMTWFERIGMLRVAEAIEHPTDRDRDGD